MKPRTLQILQALVNEFIATANPVASKALLKSCNLTVSASTIRNEFAILEEIGLIRSPHTSAGKVPTPKGYRFYVDEFLDEEHEKETTLLQSLFAKHLEQYRLEKSKEMIFDALRIMAQLSGNVAFVSLDNDHTFYLGLSQVLRSPEFCAHPERAAQIVEILEGRERFHQLLCSLKIPKHEIKIFIGEENILEQISSCTMLVTSFANKQVSGKLGILGPMRTNYGFNKALMENALHLFL